MVDISHVADSTFYQALELSRAPVIASHSSSRALTNAPRNMTDDMLRALAAKNGVAQVNFYCAFISQKYFDTAKQLGAQHDPDYEEGAGAVHEAADAGGRARNWRRRRRGWRPSCRVRRLAT